MGDEVSYLATVNIMFTSGTLPQWTLDYVYYEFLSLNNAGRLPRAYNKARFKIFNLSTVFISGRGCDEKKPV